MQGAPRLFFRVHTAQHACLIVWYVLRFLALLITCLVTYRDEIQESTFLLRFPHIILRFLRLEVSTFVFAFLQNAIHEQT